MISFASRTHLVLFVQPLRLVGGGQGVFACMLLIRHKTLHRIFMLGIPAVMVLQAAILLGIHHILLARGFL